MTEASLRYEGWRVVGASGVGVCCGSLFFFTFPLFLKPLTDEFSWSREAVSVAFGCMTFAAAVSAPLIGHMVDRAGTRRINAPSLMLAACAFASLFVLTPRLWHLYAIFAVIGLTATGTSGVAYSRAVSSWFDGRRGIALGVVIASGAVGAVMHPPLVQALIRTVGWRSTCVIVGAAMVLVGAPVIARFVRERPVRVTGRSSNIAGASVGDAVRSRVFWILLVVVFGSTIATNGAIVHLSALLTDRGVPASRAALAVSAFGMASLAGRLLTGWLLDRFAAPRVSFVLLSIAAVGTFLLAQADSFVAGVMAAVLMGLGTGGELDVTPYLLSRYFGLRSLSTLFGLNWTAWGIAGAVGPVLLGRAFDATGSYERTLGQLAFATLAVATLMLALPPYTPSAARKMKHGRSRVLPL